MIKIKFGTGATTLTCEKGQISLDIQLHPQVATFVNNVSAAVNYASNVFKAENNELGCFL